MRWRFGLIALVALSCAAGVASASAEQGTGRAGLREGQPPPAATAAPGGAAAPSATATRLVSVSASESEGRTVITLQGNGTLVPRAVEPAKDQPPRVLADFPGVTSAVPVTTPVNSAVVRRIRVAENSASPLVTRVVVDLKKDVPYSVERKDNAVVLTIGTVAKDAAAPTAAAAASATSGASPAPAKAAATGPATSGAAGKATPAPAASAAGANGPAARAVEPAKAPAAPAGPKPPVVPPPADPVGPATEPAEPGADQVIKQSQPGESNQDKPFSGHPVSLDFQGVDLRAVLRTFAEITGLNIVIDPSVQGTVDVSLREVPWDQALDIILRANQLGYTTDGNIVRIAPLGKLREEQEERRKLAEARALSGELEMLTRTLSYAKAEEMVPLLTRAALTQRGSIQVDKRTNTLIIRDLPVGLEASRQLLNSLDTAQPQVEIEARIVQTNRNFLRELGMRWSVGLEASQRLGNALPLSYPNQVGVTGGSVLATQNPPTSVIGLATSAINGAFNLDVELMAAERQGKVRILSTPRVSTQNNVEAEISQGTQIPVQTVANNTVTVTFKDATLTLRVRPQITSSNTVIMNVSVENGQPDYTREVNGIPPIDTQRANTQVQVTDGSTTVIGGIFVSREQDIEDRVPGLHRVPLLGWLFKSQNKSDESQELLIFLTPRIIKS